jgi:hypothetical protein
MPFFIEHVDIVYLLSGSDLQRRAPRPGAKPHPRPNKVLLFYSDPDPTNKIDAGDLVKDLVNALTARGITVDCLEKDAATPGSFCKCAEGVGAIVIVGHGVAKDSPSGESGQEIEPLASALGRNFIPCSKEPGLTAYELAKLNLSRVQAVFLVACNTSGTTSVYKLASGLRASCLFAGAGCVVSSLWKVPNKETLKVGGRGKDLASRGLMGGILDDWIADTQTVHSALLQAKRVAIASGDNGHPYFWYWAFTGLPDD